MQTIAVLLTVYNRKEKTILCLQNLYAQLPINGYEVDVYMTDDGSTDGTSEYVAEQFHKVNIIHSKGVLFWNRGMFTAWKAAANNKDYDYYLWLNNDTYIFDGAIKKMLYSSKKRNESIIVATVCSKYNSHEITYGAFSFDDKFIIPNAEEQECKCFNGNCVLVPKCVYKKIGNLDWHYRHAIGDLDYGYRARKAGFKIYCSPEYLGYCESNPKLPIWTCSKTPLKKRLRNLYSPLGYAEPWPFFYYEWKNINPYEAIKHLISIHIRVLFPKLWER